jgi:hypothetical protein
MIQSRSDHLLQVIRVVALIVGLLQMLLAAFVLLVLQSERSYLYAENAEPIVLTHAAVLLPTGLIVMHGLAMYSAWTIQTRWWSLLALAVFSAAPIAAIAILWYTASRMNRLHESPLYQLFIKSGTLRPTEWGSEIRLLFGVMVLSLDALLGILPLLGALLLAFRRS